MRKLKVVNIVGARPNLMKMAPIAWEMKNSDSIDSILLHTGQHYDKVLSDVFFQQLDIPTPDYNLGVGSGSHSYQTAQIMIRLEKLLVELHPSIVLVVGDVNSTMAGALVAAKLNIPLAHIEAGLRSFDQTMPEEINRKVTDAIAQFLFVTEDSGIKNLQLEGVRTFLNEGKPIERISPAVLEEFLNLYNNSLSTPIVAFVGNVMIDTMLAVKEKAEREAQIDVPDYDYGLVTLHRPSNVDNPDVLTRIMTALEEICESLPLIFPIHPRTRQRIEKSEFKIRQTKLKLIEPLGYLEFLKLMSHAKLVLTDSGGIQEETTILDVPCLTLRENTERPITLTRGTNFLVGSNPKKIMDVVNSVLNGQIKKGIRPELWDGRAAGRIVKILEQILHS